MSKENKTVFIDNVLNQYLKDKTWLAILVGMNPKNLNDILSDDKTTYKQLQDLLARGGLSLQISIQGEVPSNAKASRMQFLKYNLKIHGNPDHAIQKAVHRQTVPQIWWDEDDITIGDLVSLEKYFGFRLLFTVSGIGNTDDTVKNQPIKKISNIKEISKKTLIKYQEMLKIFNSTQQENCEIEEQKPETQDVSPVIPQKGKTENDKFRITEATNQEPAQVIDGNKQVKYSVAIEEKQYYILKKIAKRKNIQTKTLIEQIITDQNSFVNIHLKKWKKGVTTSRLTEINQSAIDNIEKITTDKKITKVSLFYNVFKKFIKENEEYYKYKTNGPSTSETDNIQNKEKQIMKNKENATDISMSKWLANLPHNQTNVLYNELRDLDKEDLIKGPYGQDTINAIRPFVYPSDEKLIALSVALRKAAQEKQVVFGEIEEPSYTVRHIIRANDTLCEQYVLMKEVANYLNSTINKKPMPLETDVTIDKKKTISIKSLSAFRPTDEDDIRLVAIVLKKGFFGQKETKMYVTPTLFTVEQWYQIADKALKHYNDNCNTQIIETIKASESEYDNQFKFFIETMDRLIRKIVLEVSNTNILHDFAYIMADKTMWHDVRIKNSKVIMKEYSDEGKEQDIKVEEELSPLDKQMLLKALRDHILAKCSK